MIYRTRTTQDAQAKNTPLTVHQVLVRVLKAKPEQSIQLALLTSELRKIFANAPPIPSASSTDGNNGNRKPIEGECPICVMDFEPDKESIVYCKAACGNNIHKQCFGKWAASKKDGAELTCPYCRTPWAVEDTTELKTISKAGKPNEEGYVNVAGELGISGRRGKFFLSFSPLRPTLRRE